MDLMDRSPGPPIARSSGRRCTHLPCCPSADNADREAALTLVGHPEQGWSLLCNGVIVFDDTGILLPDSCTIAPHCSTDS
jgi:uncharacterized protein DUF5999